MNRPNLFLIGAPKCGTTSMAEWLSQHPAVFLPIVKEPHYFNFDHNNRTFTDLQAYLDLYRAAREKRILLDASVWYMFSEVAVGNILEFDPDAKFMVLVRNPVEMAYSLHDQTMFSEYEDVADFEQAWDLQAARREGRLIPKRCREPRFLQYEEACSLGGQLERVLATCRPDRVKIFFTEDLRDDPQRVYLEAVAFLDLEDDGRTEFPVVNVAREARSIALRRGVAGLSWLKKRLRVKSQFGVLNALVRSNYRPRARPPLDPAFTRRLIDAFAADMATVERVTGRCLPHWFEPGK